MQLLLLFKFQVATTPFVAGLTEQLGRLRSQPTVHGSHHDGIVRIFL